MIIIGERLNSTSKTVRLAIQECDSAFVCDLAVRQAEAGADYIDLNSGMFIKDEPERLEWMVNTVQETINTPLSIDSPNPAAIGRALKANKNPAPLINSITDEKERFESILPMVLEYGASVIALCMDDEGLPETVDERFRIADRLITKLTKAGLPPDRIYVDPLVRPIGTGPLYGVIVLDTMRRIRESFPDVHITSGLSNISYGLPSRKLLNRTFLAAAVYAGADAAILDPLDNRLVSILYAAEALTGRDEYCLEYLARFREGSLEA